MVAPIRYRSPDEDSARWAGLRFRPGDIVITTRSKSGTTWMQMLCALLIFRRPELPGPLAELSPWLDHLIAPIDQVAAALDSQTHRRFIKTHTPLDGLPIRDEVTYITVARHPLDMAVSLYHQGANIDRQRVRELTGGASPSRSPETQGREPARPDLSDWLRRWIDSEADPRRELDSLPGVLHHLGESWAHRDEPNMVLVHYDHLLDDLVGEMGKLATNLGMAIDRSELVELSEAATFRRMKANSEILAPDSLGVLKDREAFFRRGSSGAGAEILTPAELDHYRSRAETLAPADLLAWLHHRQPGRTL